MRKIVFIFIILIGFQGCKDFLTVEPIEQISINTQLSTKQGVLEALNGAYYETRRTVLSDAFYTYGDLLSGNLSFSPNTSNGVVTPPIFVDMIYDFSDEKTESELQGFYQGCYSIINNLNLILENVDALSDASSEEKSQIKAEVLALRAFTHFNLYKIYSQNYTFTDDASHLGIVYNTRSLKVGIDYPSRETAKRTFELLTEDINNAIGLYKTSKAIPAGEEYQFLNLNAAKCLAAEIALWRNDWDTAIKWSNDVIANSGKSLGTSADLISNWAQTEKIWDFGRTENDNLLTNLYMYSSGSKYSDYALSKDYINLLEAGDLRKNLYESKSLRGKSYLFTTKFRGISGIIYRLTEMYFIRAEANLKKNNSALALQDINLIRNRAGLSSLTSINIQDIIKEKRKEFVYENKTFYDLMRNHQNVVRVDCMASTYCNINYPNFRLVAPIPQQAVEINSNVQQNPGY